MNRLEQYIIRNKRVWPCPDQESALIAGSGSATYCITKTDFLERIAEENRPSFSDHPDAKCFACDAEGRWSKNTFTAEVKISGATYWVASTGDMPFEWVWLQKGKPIGDWRGSLMIRPEQKDFNKAELKDGVIVTYRNGDERIIYNGNFYREQTNDEVSEWVYSSTKTNTYNEKGFSIKGPTLDIMKVVYMGELLWERPGPEPTTEQLRINTIRTKIEYLTNQLE